MFHFWGRCMKSKLATVGLVSVGVIFFVAFGHARQQGNVKEFMRKKLEHSQKILQGLTTEDFPLIQKNAESLTVLSQAAAWQAFPTIEYTRHSTEFQRLTEELAQNAAQKNLDGATLTYVKLTMNCVACHKYVRSNRRA